MNDLDSAHRIFLVSPPVFQFTRITVKIKDAEIYHSMRDEKQVRFGASLVGRLARTDLSLSHGLQPLFEGISNSLHTIDDSKRKDGRIIIRVIRDDLQQRLKDDAGHINCRPIRDIHIEDNGDGFTDANFGSFCTADSLHKRSRGGKGIGRLLWLKTFTRVEIESVFVGGKGFADRSFWFVADDKSPIQKHSLKDSASNETKTIIRLTDFLAAYKEACRHKPETLADRIIRHFLLLFLRKDCPSMILVDDDAEEAIDLNKRHADEKTSEVEADPLCIGSHELQVITIHAKASLQGSHELQLCADGFEVNAINLGKRLPHLPDKIPDLHSGHGTRLAVCVTGDILDKKVNEHRTGFNLPKETQGDLYEPTEEQIIKEACAHVERKLEPLLSQEREKSRQRIRSFITERRPVYRSLLDKLDAHLPDLSQSQDDDDLDLRLNTITRKIEITAESEFSGYRNVARDEAVTAFKKYWEQVDCAAQVRLSQYVVRRRVVLQALKKLLEQRSDGKYPLEADIHDLIFPMGKTSDEVAPERWNLWLIDERLAFHDHLASDKPLKSIKVANTDSADEPDLIVFNRPGAFAEGHRPMYDSIVIIEFKKPMRDDVGREELPHEQAQRYMKEIRAGKIRDTRGRPITTTETTRFYGYLVCDFTAELREKLSDQGFKLSPDSNGYFQHNENARERRFEYFEYISLDKLLDDAEKRNQALFHRLGIVVQQFTTTAPSLKTNGEGTADTIPTATLPGP